jgi:hypothetical protein
MSAALPRVFPDRETLLSGVQEVLAKYEGTAVTVRQLYYRLVAAGLIPNNQRAYKNVVQALTDWRRARKIPIRAFEDRTRGMNRLDRGWRRDDPKGWLRGWLEKAIASAQAYEVARWFGQPERVVVAVEKQALEGPFTEVCEELEVDLAVCRGYPSISFLSEVAGALSRGDADRDKRANVILYFGDLDPSGMNIPETVERDLGAGLFGQAFELDRVALTQQQVEELQLIPAPVKTTDSRAAGFIEEHGAEVYELDAIEPKRLQQLIREAVGRHWSAEISTKRDAMVAAGRELIRGRLEGSGIQELADELGGDDSSGGDGT